MKKIIYIDMDDVLCDFTSAHKEGLAKNPEIIYPQNQYGYWRKLKPLKNAIETVAYLKEHFDVYILSSPSIYNPFCYAEKRVWVEEHLGFDMLEKLILSHNKGLNKGDYLIDDHINGKGQENFEGKLLHYGSEEFSDWDKVKDYFYNVCNVDKSSNYSSENYTVLDVQLSYKGFVASLGVNPFDTFYCGIIENSETNKHFSAETMKDLIINFKIKVDSNLIKKDEI